MPEPDPGLRLNVLPARRADSAEGGWQVAGRLDEVDAVADAGAQWLRIQFSWEAVEGMDGTFALQPQHAAVLDRAAERGLKCFIVAAYGPPREIVQTLTVAADVPSLTARVQTVEDASAVDPRTDFLVRASGPQLTSKWAYYGSAIAAGDGEGLTAASRIVPAVPSLEWDFPIDAPKYKPLVEQMVQQYPYALKAGDKLMVNRLLYAPLYRNDPTDPSIQAFVRYATWLAWEMDRRGVRGYVNLWNEDAWPHDRWNHGASFWDTPPQWAEDVPRMGAIHLAAMEAELPEGVKFCTGATDKTGASSPAWGADEETTEKLRKTIVAGGIHPYGQNPESAAWTPRYSTKNGSYVVLNEAQDGGGNFQTMAAIHDRKGLKVCATEQGGLIADDDRHATYTLRRLLSQWGAGVMENSIYALAEPTWGAMLRTGTKAAPTLTPRPTYLAVQRLFAIRDSLGPGEGDTASIPALVGAPDSPAPLMTVGLRGESGGALFLWQRSFIKPGETWAAKSLPPSIEVDLYLSKGYGVDRVLNVRTGESVELHVDGPHLHLSGVSDDVIVVVSVQMPRVSAYKVPA